jgi:hypothetical protein
MIPFCRDWLQKSFLFENKVWYYVLCINVCIYIYQKILSHFIFKQKKTFAANRDKEGSCRVDSVTFHWPSMLTQSILFSSLIWSVEQTKFQTSEQTLLYLAVSSNSPLVDTEMDKNDSFFGKNTHASATRGVGLCFKTFNNGN